MLRNYLAAALHNLARNRLYAGVTIAGLAVGFAAAMLIGLYVRDELTFDRFIPGHERVYLVANTVRMPGFTPLNSEQTPMSLARPFVSDFPQVERVARVSSTYFPPVVRHGDVAANESNVVWADPDLFKVLPLPALAGDLATALEAPDGVVVTRAVARKYFGRDTPVGEVLTIDKRPMRVTAVLENLPSNTHLTHDIFASARSPDSNFTIYEPINGPLTNVVRTYVRLRPGASAAPILPQLPAFLERRLPLGKLTGQGPVERSLEMIPLDDLHFYPSTLGVFKPPANRSVVVAIGGVGALIILVAGINFVTLMTARAARRAVEVGVRKAAGATRRDLIVQFMTEAFGYVLVAGVLALAIAELALPAFNALLQRKLTFDYLGDPALAAAVLATLALTALLAGAYPAFVLSAFRPAAVLKGGLAQAAGGGRLRQALVVVQFAVLIGLILVTITIARQTLFALNEGMRVDKDQVLAVMTRPCSTVMRDELAKVPGVRRTACASAGALGFTDNRDNVTVNGRKATLQVTGMDFGYFEVFGVKPLAGRLFDPARPGDGNVDSHSQPVVINETAMRQLGFRSPQAALGQVIVWHGIWDETQRAATFTVPSPTASRVIGVVPDFTLASLREPIKPVLYAIARNAPPMSIGLVAKLDGKRNPEVLAAVDRIWRRVGDGGPVIKVFIDFLTMRLYLDALVQGATVALAAVVALSIACLGLFALSAYTTERRTKEIGVRKAMGASAGDILRLLLWQFSKPVLWANLIAWPVAYLLMDRWLKGFAYRVDLAPWTFVAGGAGALAIAWATVFLHALRVARARPVNALRYE